MSFLQILTMILQLAPQGVNVTMEILTLIQAIEKAFATPGQPAQEAVVKALAAHLNIANKG